MEPFYPGTRSRPPPRCIRLAFFFFRRRHRCPVTWCRCEVCACRSSTVSWLTPPPRLALAIFFFFLLFFSLIATLSLRYGVVGWVAEPCVPSLGLSHSSPGFQRPQLQGPRPPRGRSAPSEPRPARAAGTGRSAGPVSLAAPLLGPLSPSMSPSVLCTRGKRPAFPAQQPLSQPGRGLGPPAEPRPPAGHGVGV